MTAQEEVEARTELEAQVGQVWNTTELTEEFRVISFLAPFVSVERKADNAKGTLQFTHNPRFYFQWMED